MAEIKRSDHTLPALVCLRSLVWMSVQMWRAELGCGSICSRGAERHGRQRGRELADTEAEKKRGREVEAEK